LDFRPCERLVGDGGGFHGWSGVGVCFLFFVFRLVIN
jgi:hypothetical protein